MNLLVPFLFSWLCFSAARQPDVDVNLMIVFPLQRKFWFLLLLLKKLQPPWRFHQRKGRGGRGRRRWLGRGPGRVFNGICLCPFTGNTCFCTSWAWGSTCFVGLELFSFWTVSRGWKKRPGFPFSGTCRFRRAGPLSSFGKILVRTGGAPAKPNR
jgi:hypothetical protein